MQVPLPMQTEAPRERERERERVCVVQHARGLIFPTSQPTYEPRKPLVENGFGKVWNKEQEKHEEISPVCT